MTPEGAVEQHGHSVHGLARRFALTTGLRGHEDDLAQEGLIALVKGVRHDPVATWDAYYMGRVLGAMKDYLRRERRKPQTEELEDELDLASSGPSSFEQMDQHDRLAQVFHLPDRERVAVFGHALEWSDGEIAQGLGVSTRRVRHLRAQGERRLAS